MTRVRHSPRLEPDRTDWRASAACLGMDPRLFFPEPSHKGPRTEDETQRIHEQTERARGVCGSCDVVPDCLAWALAHEEWGVWGGTTDSDRKKIKRNRNRRPAA